MTNDHDPAIVLAPVTCADAAEARRIGRALVAENLAACVHLRPHEAIYRWQQRVEAVEEYALIAKTTAASFPALQSRVLALHSHELPCILMLPVAGGHAPFLEWVSAGSTGIV